MFIGIIIGAVTFIIIGVFHPIVVKAEYYWGSKCWPLFLVCGLFFLFLSILFENVILSGILGVLGFTSLWSIKEIHEQVVRVAKGWSKANPKRYNSTKI
ncbi:MAG: DUF4491 family protein [Spirochaetaceae bacterium]